MKIDLSKSEEMKSVNELVTMLRKHGRAGISHLDLYLPAVEGGSDCDYDCVVSTATVYVITAGGKYHEAIVHTALTQLTHLTDGSKRVVISNGEKTVKTSAAKAVDWILTDFKKGKEDDD